MPKQPQPVDLISSSLTHAIQHVNATRMHLAAAASEGDRVALMVRGAMLSDRGIAAVAAAGKVEDALAAVAAAVNAGRAAEAALVGLVAELTEGSTGPALS